MSLAGFCMVLWAAAWLFASVHQALTDEPTVFVHLSLLESMILLYSAVMGGFGLIAVLSLRFPSLFGV